jgi:hypothetical protein
VTDMDKMQAHGAEERSDTPALSDGGEGAEPFEEGFNWSRIKHGISEMRNHYRLYCIILGIFFFGFVGMYALVQPEYTAVAVIGPPGFSPTDQLMSGGLSGALGAVAGAGGGMAKKLLGAAAGAGSANDPFQEYQQMLTSTRLALVLIQRDQMLQRVFHRKWNWKNKEWITIPIVTDISMAVKGLLQRPAHIGRDVDDLTEYFSKELDIRDTEEQGAIAILPGSSTYKIVSFKFDDPEQAQDILNAILLEADSIIREDQQRDVLARIAYIEKELPRVTIEDERDSLISILSQQQQLLVMTKADKRFASTLVDPAHASLKPTFPPNPIIGLLMAVILSTATWVGLVSLRTRSGVIGNLVRRFGRKPSYAPTVGSSLGHSGKAGYSTAGD